MELEQLKLLIGKRLRKTREQKGLSQEDIAKQLDLTTGAYGSFERGKNLVGLNYLIELARILETPITYFLPSHIITNSERNNAMLDPLLQGLIAVWPDLPRPIQKAVAEFVRACIQAKRNK